MPPPILFFFLRIALASQGLYIYIYVCVCTYMCVYIYIYTHTYFKIGFSTSVKKSAFGILVGIALNLKLAFGNRDILTILPVHEQKIVFHLFV